MITYIGLIIVELLLAFGIKLMIPDKRRQERLIAGIGMFLIFLLLALKKDTVGIDIIGYKEQYEIAGQKAWNNFSYVYYEPGYLLLTKIFAKQGFPFQFFTVIVYGVLCYSVYLLIRRFSPNATLSILIFICYNFLVFSISGLRQALAMGICLYAFLLALRFTKASAIGAVCLNLAAVSIHESAIVFFAVLALVAFRNRPVRVSLWTILTLAVFGVRSRLWDIVEYFYGKTITGFEFSGTLIFLTGMVFFLSLTYVYYKERRVVLPCGTKQKVLLAYDALLVRDAFLSLMCYLMFSGGTLLRANMYFTLLLIPGIPMAISKYEYRTRAIWNMAMTAFLVALFYKYTLSINQLELWPYFFFWQ